MRLVGNRDPKYAKRDDDTAPSKAQGEEDLYFTKDSSKAPLYGTDISSRDLAVSINVTNH